MLGISGPRLTTALVAGLVSVILLGGGIAVWIGGRTPGSAHAASSAVPVTARSSPAAAASPPSATAGTCSTSDSATDAPTTGGAAVPALCLAGPSMNLSVQLAAAVRSSRQGAALQSAFQRYFDAINQHDYSAWTGTVTTELAAGQSETEWTHAYSSTTDSTIWLDAVQTGPLRAKVRFTSQQDLSLAPDDLQARCIMWTLTYRVAESDGQLLVGSTVPGSVSKTACP